ncbi:MAG: TIGR01777 family oxidoreductase [Desulfobacterales bacterium]
MNILVTGGLGFIGRHLSNLLLDQGHEVTAIGTRPNPRMIEHPKFHYIAADTQKEGDWQESARQADAVVNLAGRSIFRYWSKKNKREIHDSRILTTRNLVKAISGGNCGVLCSTSAVGFYGDGGEKVLTEDADPGDDFLARLSLDWEREAKAAENHDVRVVIMRFGIVLAHDGGAMSKMIPAYRLFLGGSMGSGRQWFSWIHMKDLIDAAAFAASRKNFRGTYNFCSPVPVRQKDLAKTLGSFLRRPAVLHIPGFFIELLLGEFGRMLLNSQRAVPRNLQQQEFEFQYPTLDAALHQVVEKGFWVAGVG